ncbi:MAG: hypothetical protein IH862_12395 [Chloroflexi bacterium]|nr:hypothetical protein [Chloroflexota bacterium]
MAMTFELETIDREKAQEYIAKNVANRPTSQAHVNLLIGRQRRGEWKTNGDTIRFDTNGNLRDGQHRLHMVMLTGIPIEVIVIRGVDPDSFVTMDTGKPRTIIDVLAIKREPNPRFLAGALQWTYRYLFDRMVGKIESHDLLISVLEAHEGIHKTVAFYADLNQPIGAPGQRDIALAMHYLFSKVDRKGADDFIERYVTGLRLEEETDPVGRLRGQIISVAANPRISLIPSQYFGLFAMAWNANRLGKKTAKSAFQTPKRTAGRPKIDGFPEQLFMTSKLALLDEEEDEAA